MQSKESRLNLCRCMLGMVILAAGLLLQAGRPGVVDAQSTEWSAPINLSSTTTKSWLPSACADRAGNLHVVWGEFVDPQSSTSDTLYYTRWDGKEWTEPADILITGRGPASQAQNAVWYPACAADGFGRLHVVWTDTHSIYYSRATIGKDVWKAAAWSAPRAIFPNPNAPGGFPHIAVDSQDTIHVVFNTYDESLHIRSTDGGQTWSEPISLAVTPDRATRPRLLIDDQDILHVGITEVNETDNGIGILYNRSLDSGQSWGEAQQLDADFDAEYPIEPAIGMDGQDMLHVVWVGWRNGAFYHQVSADAGASWSRPKEVLRVPGGIGFRATAMATDSAGALHLLLSYRRDALHQQWTGSGWTQSVNVSRSETSSDMPTLLVTSGNQLHAVWLEYVAGQGHVHEGGNMEVFYSTASLPAPSLLPSGFLASKDPAAPTGLPSARRAVRECATATPTPARVSPDRVPNLESGQSGPLTVGIVLTTVAMALVVGLMRWRRE